MEEQLATAVPDLATSKLVSVLLHCQVLHAELAAGHPWSRVPLLLPLLLPHATAELPACDQTGQQLRI